MASLATSGRALAIMLLMLIIAAMMIINSPVEAVRGIGVKDPKSVCRYFPPNGCSPPSVG
uniref:Uncharacterized protein n=1 Tax=Oryza meridionalis TaxID=40149 RepID=A0A0E0EXX7_9ORYZ